jgi:hypothetical protein
VNSKQLTRLWPIQSSPICFQLDSLLLIILDEFLKESFNLFLSLLFKIILGFSMKSGSNLAICLTIDIEIGNITDAVAVFEIQMDKKLVDVIKPSKILDWKKIGN